MKVSAGQLTVLAFAAATAAALALRPPAPDDGAAPESAASDGEEWYGPREVRIMAKHLVAGEAAAGRRPLAEAAALFGALDRLPPAAPDPASVPPYGGRRGDGERLCRQVIDWAAPLPGRPAPPGAAETVTRLEREFEALRRAGPVRLPDPDTLESVEALLARTKEALTPAERRAVLGRRGDGR
jgi:hypothetical protein